MSLCCPLRVQKSLRHTFFQKALLGQLTLVVLQTHALLFLQVLTTQHLLERKVLWGLSVGRLLKCQTKQYRGRQRGSWNLKGRQERLIVVNLWPEDKVAFNLSSVNSISSVKVQSSPRQWEAQLQQLSSQGDCPPLPWTPSPPPASLPLTLEHLLRRSQARQSFRV